MKYLIGLLILIFLFFVFCIDLRIENFKKVKPKINKFNYKLFYADEKTDKENVISGKLLKSDKYKLKGKPDYIIKHKIFNKFIPIELKSGTIKDDKYPREYELMQLAVYFLIIEDLYGSRPRYGYLVYKDYMFIVKNTKKLRKEVLNRVNNMKLMLDNGLAEGFAEPSYNKCKLCKYRKDVCQFCQK